MFQRILLPLDGSHMAESAIPAVRSIALAFSSTVTLIHLLEKDAPKAVHGERHLASVQDAEAYLADIAKRCFSDIAKVDFHVHTEEVADVSRGLSEHSKELSQDLIVMCVHGSGGLTGAMEGNIAERIVSLQSVPVLLVRPDSAASVSSRVIVVATDGKAEHEASLPLAASLAHSASAKIKLITVVPSWWALRGTSRASGLFLPAAAIAASDVAAEEADDHLKTLCEKLGAEGTEAEYVMRRGNPARKIASFVREESADLVVLGTHGKAGSKAFWAGSEAAKIVDRLKAPVLLVPSKG